MYEYERQQSVDQNSEPVFTDLTHMQNVRFMANMAMASLSYDPATEREMYPAIHEKGSDI